MDTHGHGILVHMNAQEHVMNLIIQTLQAAHALVVWLMLIALMVNMSTKIVDVFVHLVRKSTTHQSNNTIASPVKLNAFNHLLIMTVQSNTGTPIHAQLNVNTICQENQEMDSNGITTSAITIVLELIGNVILHMSWILIEMSAIANVQLICKISTILTQASSGIMKKLALSNALKHAQENMIHHLNIGIPTLVDLHVMMIDLMFIDMDLHGILILVLMIVPEPHTNVDHLRPWTLIAMFVIVNVQLIWETSTITTLRSRDTILIPVKLNALPHLHLMILQRNTGTLTHVHFSASMICPEHPEQAIDGTMIFVITSVLELILNVQGHKESTVTVNVLVHIQNLPTTIDLEFTGTLRPVLLIAYTQNQLICQPTNTGINMLAMPSALLFHHHVQAINNSTTTLANVNALNLIHKTTNHSNTGILSIAESIVLEVLLHVNLMDKLGTQTPATAHVQTSSQLFALQEHSSVLSADVNASLHVPLHHQQQVAMLPCIGVKKHVNASVLKMLFHLATIAWTAWNTGTTFLVPATATNIPIALIWIATVSNWHLASVSVSIPNQKAVVHQSIHSSNGTTSSAIADVPTITAKDPTVLPSHHQESGIQQHVNASVELLLFVISQFKDPTWLHVNVTVSHQSNYVPMAMLGVVPSVDVSFAQHVVVVIPQLLFTHKSSSEKKYITNQRNQHFVTLSWWRKSLECCRKAY
jgi:hypothetical protein